MITISEISNEDVSRYSNDSGECVSYLAYQIEIYAEQDEYHTAIKNIDRLCDIVDTYMKQDRYYCMRRLGDVAKTPLNSDNNVMIGFLRYECNVDLKTNTIYRRY